MEKKMKVNLLKTKRIYLILILIAIISGTLFAQKGGGGGGTTGPNPLPQTPPAPNIIMRDSFGQGPQMLRPASGNGTLKSTALGVSINGFWLEYLGSKDFRWITTDSGDTWRYCGTGPNPYQLPSPLEITFGFEQNTILCTHLNAPLVSATRPTALIPLPSNLNTPYEVEIEGLYWRIPGGYVALGLTNSGTTINNLVAGASVMLIIKPNPADNLSTMIYEFRLGGLNGQLLASGITEESEFFNQMKIRYNPQNRSIGASYKGVDLGTFATNVPPPRYAAFEGVGYVDNFVVRTLP